MMNREFFFCSIFFFQNTDHVVIEFYQIKMEGVLYLDIFCQCSVSWSHLDNVFFCDFGRIADN